MLQVALEEENDLELEFKRLFDAMKTHPAFHSNVLTCKTLM